MSIGKTEISQRGTVKEHEETVTAAVRENYKERNPQKKKQWNGLPREAGDFPSLKIFKT